MIGREKAGEAQKIRTSAAGREWSSDWRSRLGDLGTSRNGVELICAFCTLLDYLR